MAVSILGGRAKGHSLLVPKGDLIRPTSVRLKRKVFDSHQDWSGRTLVDLCCGSGAFGLEGWSRGAEDVLLIEKNKKVVSFTQKNKDSLEKIFNAQKIKIYSDDVIKFLNHFALTYQSWGEEKRLNTYLFFDPPYEFKDLYEKVFSFILDKMNFIGEFWIESDRQKAYSLDYWQSKGHPPYKSFQQGTSYIVLFDYSPTK